MYHGRSMTKIPKADSHASMGSHPNRQASLPSKKRNTSSTGPKLMAHHVAIRMVLLVLAMALLAGCAVAPPRNPLPEGLSDEMIYEGIAIPSARWWGDALPRDLVEKYAETRDQLEMEDPEAFNRPVHYLAISGGGANGAFGAGLLKGWTAAGNRPAFHMVTGISTGALIAPFAFIGPEKDSILEEFYTTTSTKDILKKRWIFALLRREAGADSTPLQNILKDIIDGPLIEAIAAEHKRGRRLFIGTANLDAGRPVMWNIGAIANSGHPDAVQLIRDVLLASASIPGMFPPVLMKVDAGEETFDEMHVDGGTANQVFLYPASLDERKAKKELGVRGKSHLWIIRNGFINPRFEIVPNKATRIAGRSVNLLIRTQANGDLQRLYLQAEKDKMTYRLAYIPDTFNEKSTEDFDPVYMGKLFNLGYEMAQKGFPWQKSPPGFENK